MKNLCSVLFVMVLFGLPLAGCGDASRPTSSPGTGASGNVQTESRLQTVLSRGTLICGVSGVLPGFSFVGPDGAYSGLDVDICRAIAAALFDNPDAVEYRNLNAKERFTAVQSGEVDILSRNTTWTMSRDTTVQMDFAPVVFYDSQGLMVRKNSGIKSLEDLANKSICTQTGTTNEQNIADQMGKRNLRYTPVVFEDVDAAYTAYLEGRCEAMTSDRSQLASRRINFPKPEEHIILDVLLSKEPLAPAVAAGDSRWHAVVKWSIYALINAEEYGITSKNVSEFLTSPDPSIQRFLGVQGSLATDAGLPKDFAVRILRHVGNYGEIYDRHLGPNSRLQIPRSLNNLWTQGGLMYSPPFR